MLVNTANVATLSSPPHCLKDKNQSESRLVLVQCQSTGWSRYAIRTLAYYLVYYLGPGQLVHQQGHLVHYLDTGWPCSLPGGLLVYISSRLPLHSGTLLATTSPSVASAQEQGSPDQVEQGVS